MSVLLITDRNDSGFKLRFQEVSEKEFEIIHTSPTIGRTKESEDFTRLTIRNYTKEQSVWLDIAIQQVKRNRSYCQSMSIDKKQLELLIEKLILLKDKMIY